jgi:hypothetical protein
MAWDGNDEERLKKLYAVAGNGECCDCKAKGTSASINTYMYA